MLKVRGWQVSPAELEAALLLHPDISDAAVVGMCLRQGDNTELPRAYVVKPADSNLSEREIKHFMASRVARYKNLDGGVAFVDTIPRNSASKVQRGILRDRAIAEACEINNNDGKNLSASTTPNRKYSFEGGRISLNSSVTSYDGANETGTQSRRDSNSTTGTVHSEATGRTSESARTAVSTKYDFKYDDKPLKDQASNGLPPEYDGAGDLRSHIEHAFAERGKGRSDPITSRCMLSSPARDNMDTSTPQVSMDLPISTCKVSELPDIGTSVPDQPALSDLKKRTAEKTKDIMSTSKKSKTNSKVDRSTENAEDAYRRAMAIVVKERSIRLD